MQDKKDNEISGSGEIISLLDGSKEFQALQRLIIAQLDFQAAKESAKAIVNDLKNEQHPLYSSLECATFVSYSRPFIGRRGYPSLPKRYLKFGDGNKKLSDMHEKIIEIRNEFMAHRDNQRNRVLLVEDTKPATKGSALVLKKCNFDEDPDAPSHLVFGATGQSWERCQPSSFLSSYLPVRWFKVPAFKTFIELVDFQLARIEDHIQKEILKIERRY